MLPFDAVLNRCESLLNSTNYPGEPEYLSNSEIALLARFSKKIHSFLKDEEIIDEFSNEHQKEMAVAVVVTLLPGKIDVCSLPDCNIKKSIEKEKLDAAVAHRVMNGEDFHAVKKSIGLDKEYECPSKLPEAYNKVISVESDLRNENDVRKFFSLYPYASVVEASKTTGLSNKKIRQIIRQIESNGETVKYTNVLRTLDFEDLKRQIIEIKKTNPRISDNELAYELEASPSQVKAAIQEAVRTMHIENADSYAFLVMKEVDQLEEVQDMARTRFKATRNSSSEWLKVILEAKKDVANLLGLKAPERLDVNQKIEHTSKEERDAALEAFLASESLDVDFERIEMTSEENA